MEHLYCDQKKFWFNNKVAFLVQAALVICGLFICEFEYMQLKNGNKCEAKK